MGKAWPCAVNGKLLYGKFIPMFDRFKLCLKGFPEQGRGDRCLYCDQYDRCLSFAVIKGWESFNCEKCSYKRRGQVNFGFEDFKDTIDDALDLDEEESIEVDPLDLQISIQHQRFDFEEALLTVIERGFDERFSGN